jgi:hypothetical protein
MANLVTQQLRKHAYEHAWTLRIPYITPTPQWWQKAACRGLTPNTTHPDACKHCPVKASCLKQAWLEEQHFVAGIYHTRGGFTPTARQRMWTELTTNPTSQ